MKKLLIFILLSSIILISGCASVSELKTVKELFGPIKIEATGDCEKVVSEEVEILQIKVPSKTTITLAALKKFHDVEDAKEYIGHWKYKDAALADLKGEIEGEIEVGVVKVDKVSEAYTYAVVCVDGEVMENSEKTLKKIG